MDVNGDGQLTEEEFVKGCLQDDELSKILTFWNFSSRDLCIKNGTGPEISF